jgi:hypothetical protein
VEHGITEMINAGVDLVEWMVCQVLHMPLTYTYTFTV